MGKEMKNINADKLFVAIGESGFTISQINMIIGHGNSYLHYVKKANRIPDEDLRKICALIKKQPRMFLETPTPEPKPEPPKQTYEPPTPRPLTAREDPRQDWLINLYRAIEDQNDRLDLLLGELKDINAAIRGLSMAIKGGVA